MQFSEVSQSGYLGTFCRGFQVNGMEVKGMTHMQVVSLATAFAELFVDVERRGKQQYWCSASDVTSCSNLIS